jgi:transposase-like protein
MKKRYKPNTAMSAYEYLREFPDAEAARLFIEGRRWPGGTACPFCNSKNVLVLTRKKSGFYHCRDCRMQFSVRTNSIFQHSNITLDKWLFAFYLIVTARKGISSAVVKRDRRYAENSLAIGIQDKVCPWLRQLWIYPKK